MAKSSGESFFSKIFGSLFNGSDPEAVKKKQLKAIAKELSHSRYKFYKHSSDQVLPVLGKFFYDIYKAIGPCMTMFQNMDNPNQLKNMTIEFSLSEQQKQLEESLSEESIKGLSANMNHAELKKKVDHDIEVFCNEFDAQKIQSIDDLYYKLKVFRQFCLYDYYFILKKFDSSMRENDFSRSPHFEAIDSSYIVEDLKDFVAIVATLPLNESWEDLMLLFKTARGVEPIKPAIWAKIITRLRNVQDSRIFDMLIQVISKDPFYRTVADEKREQIIEPFLDKIRNEALTCIRNLESQQKNSKIDSILAQIFNSTAVIVLKNYTESGAENYRKKNLGDWDYARPLNYLKAFLVEYVKREVREFADMVLIRGKWSTTPLSQQMSDAFHAMLETSDKITAFDEILAEDKEIGMKIKTLMPRSERDREAANIIGTLISDANEEAKGYIIDTTRNMITFAKNVKMLLEDHTKKSPEMIINWKELDRFAEHPLQQLGVEVYKKIYLFVTLMQNFLGSGSAE